MPLRRPPHKREWADNRSGVHFIVNVRQDIEHNNAGYQFIGNEREFNFRTSWARSKTVKIGQLAKCLRRRAALYARRPSIGAIEFGVFDRVRPISKNWGFDRGLPIDRYYIEAFLSYRATDVQGRVLEVSDNHYTRQFGGDRVTQSDILYKGTDNPKATLLADLTNAPEAPSDAFDCVICTQTLQFIFDLPAAIATIHRILRPGGVALVTLPSVSRIATPEMATYGDYWRFTTASAQRLFDDCFGDGNAAISSFGNVYAAVAFLHGLAAEDVDQGKLDLTDPNFQVLIAVRATKGGREA